MTTTPDFNLTTGDQILRQDLHKALGGQQQSGISPSNATPIVMLFADPVSGPQHGYFDGWQADGFFHYSGEGQSGDQQMKRGNKAIRDHREEDRSLELFFAQGKGQPVTYQGEFEYVDHYDTEVESGDGTDRRVFMFRLRPVDALPPTSPGEVNLTEVDVVDQVPIEAHLTERAFVAPDREPYESERREAALVKRYEQHLRLDGHSPTRHRVQPAGELKPLFTDVYVPDTNTLVEAKGSVSREAIRMALGQLLDYRRFITPSPSLAVLVPDRPRQDLVDLLNLNGVGVIYESDQEFVEIGKGA